MININTIFIIFSSILVLTSIFIYTRSVLKGEAKPHRTTFFVLSLITSLSTISLLAQHDTVAVWLASAATFQSILIFLLAIKHGMGGWSRTDLLCLGIALFGVALWQTTKDASLALLTSIAADFISMIPTLIKTYWFPKTESLKYWLLNAIAGLFNLFAVTTWTIQGFSYPAYIMLINFVMVLLIIRDTHSPSGLKAWHSLLRRIKHE